MAVAANFTSLTNLIVKFLKGGVDSYNSADLAIKTGSADSDSLGERARICINLALSKIYALIKDSKYLEAMPTESLISIADQDFIQLDTVPGIDDVESVVDTENDYHLERKSWSWYRKNYSDPASQTGNPTSYIIRNDRMYLAPRPVSALTYLVDYKKLTDDLEAGADIPLIPTQYDSWIIAEARVQWYMMEDPENVPALIVSERNEIKQASIDSIMTGYNFIRQAKSHFDDDIPNNGYGYERPVGGG